VSGGTGGEAAFHEAAAGSHVTTSWVPGDPPELVTVITEFGRIEYVSPAVREVLGYAPVEMVGRSVCDFLDADGRHNGAAWLAIAQRGGRLPELAHAAMRADGTVAHVETRLRMIRTEDGPSGLLAVTRDVSTRTEMEERLRAAEASKLWTDVIDLIREGVLVVDRSGTILAANRRVEELLGRGGGELRGAPVDRFLAPLADAPIPRALLSWLASAEPKGRDLAIRAAAPGHPNRIVGARAVPVSGSARPGCAALLLEERAPARPARPAPPRCEPLSPREIAVLRLLADGRDARAIAAELGLSIHTVRAYVKSILRKLDVRTQLQAVIVSVRSGALDLS
jgi:PAS domain S-box-containing protein